MPGPGLPFRVIACVLLLMFLFSACTKTIPVPIDTTRQPRPGDKYRITLKDERVFEGKRLSFGLNDTISFTSLHKPYTFPLQDVATLEKIEIESGKTAGVLAATFMVVGIGLYYLLQSFAESFSGLN